MTYEFDVSEGFKVQHYGADDWFPVIDARWWVREYLMCDEGREIHVYDGDDNGVSWGEVVDMLRALGDTGPYHEGPVFAELTYNRENSLSDELLIAAGWVDVGEHALHRGPGSPLLRAIKEQHPEHDWNEIGEQYIVAIAYGGCHGHSGAIADVYLSPNIDDDYDVARWQAQLHAYNARDHSTAPVWDVAGGWGNGIEGMEDAGSGYPYGSRRECLPMYDVGELTGDREDSDMPSVITGSWLACGGEGVFAIGADGRVHRVYGSVD